VPYFPNRENRIPLVSVALIPQPSQGDFLQLELKVVILKSTTLYRKIYIGKPQNISWLLLVMEVSFKIE